MLTLKQAIQTIVEVEIIKRQNDRMIREKNIQKNDLLHSKHIRSFNYTAYANALKTVAYYESLK
ncbi:hypothetical protein [Vibrio phage PhiImVa-1]|nr:hypothetical protein [Vibrio phage PhiImVa-1]